MDEITPTIPEYSGTLDCTYSISISEEMEEQIRILKKQYDSRRINHWLRELWINGLKHRFSLLDKSV